MMIPGILAQRRVVGGGGVVYPAIRNADIRTYSASAGHISFIGADTLSNIGDRLFVAIAADNGVTITTPAGWTELSNNFTASAVRLKIVWKDKAASDELASFSTGSSVRTTLVGWAIKGGTFAGAPTVSVSGSFATTSTTNDLPLVTNPSGAGPAMVVGVVAAENGPAVVGYPLPDNQVVSAVGAQLSTGICTVETLLDSYDPGAYTFSPAVTSIGRTILQRGA